MTKEGRIVIHDSQSCLRIRVKTATEMSHGTKPRKIRQFRVVVRES